jgi:anthranilate phosphoribosyltransferase
MDEISLSGPSRLWDLNEGRVAESEIDPLDFGIARAESSELKGGDAEHNAKVAVAVLEGLTGPMRDVIVINSAAGAIACGLAEDFPTAIAIASESIDSGGARRALSALVEASNS